jgi:iron(III) transport system substrate-binding protein
MVAAKTRHLFTAICTLSTAVFCLSVVPAPAQSLDELHKTALKEGGKLTFYGTLAPNQASKILPVFEKRFPGIKIDQIDATADKLAARAIAEARGGKTFADVLSMSLENVMHVFAQGLLLEKLPPEADAYPADLKGSYWIAAEFDFIVAAWNTKMVSKQDEPKQFEDLADPKWKGKLMADPRDTDLLIGLANHKYKSEEKAVALLKRIAANNLEFHRGHSQLAELLVAGQGAVCLTCYSHHFPARIKQGAPVDYMLSEGVAAVSATAVLKDAPHPNTAWLFHRWAAGEEGQRVFAAGGRTPAHPKVEPVDNTRPQKIYAINDKDYKEFSRYEKIWKEIFKIR